MTRQPVNPFYAARSGARLATHTGPNRPAPRAAAFEVQYARLPRAPRTASPVPTLTSLYHDPDPGPYGDRAYPGNCSGNLIRDLIRFLGATTVYDPMTGSGTCRDVCRELGVACHSADLREGTDACAAAYEAAFDLCWLHPPYWRQKVYSSDPRDLSRAPTLEAFLARYRELLASAARALVPGGKLAVLMGDYADREAGFVPLTYHTKRLAFDLGLRQHGTEIVRFSHGASSGYKTYRSSFIPGLHDTLVVFEKPR